jgi:hypothetical protein
VARRNSTASHASIPSSASVKGRQVGRPGHDPARDEAPKPQPTFNGDRRGPRNIDLGRNWHVEETGPLPTVPRALGVHPFRPRWPLGTLWAGGGHDARRGASTGSHDTLWLGNLSSSASLSTSAFECLYSRFQKWPFIRSFVGLDGIGPSASALSGLHRGLVRRLVCLLNCQFVPRRATN